MGDPFVYPTFNSFTREWTVGLIHNGNMFQIQRSTLNFWYLELKTPLGAKTLPGVITSATKPLQTSLAPPIYYLTQLLVLTRDFGSLTPPLLHIFPV